MKKNIGIYYKKHWIQGTGLFRHEIAKSFLKLAKASRPEGSVAEDEPQNQEAQGDRKVRHLPIKSN